MLYFRKLCFLVLLGLILVCPPQFAQSKTQNNSPEPGLSMLISGVHTLSVHVQDTLTHDSVYQFFARNLMLPVYYTPVEYAQRKYVGVYAGNMVLEPCGPYRNIEYATDNFRAIFYGLNFEVNNPLQSCQQALKKRGIEHQLNTGSIYIRDSLLCNENIFTALYNVDDKAKRDSLQNLLGSQAKSNPGIEYIKEIIIGCREEANLQKWNEYLEPLEFGENNVCQINDSLQLRFTKGSINEVKGITFKVESLQETAQYLKANQFQISLSDHKIKLDPMQSFGLLIHFTDLNSSTKSRL